MTHTQAKLTYLSIRNIWNMYIVLTNRHNQFGKISNRLRLSYLKNLGQTMSAFVNKYTIQLTPEEKKCMDWNLVTLEWNNLYYYRIFDLIVCRSLYLYPCLLHNYYTCVYVWLHTHIYMYVVNNKNHTAL